MLAAFSLLPSLRQWERKSAIFLQDAFRSKLGTVELLSMAGVGGNRGPQRGPGRADNSQVSVKAQPIFPSAQLRWRNCHIAQDSKSVPPFTNLENRLPQKQGPEYVPILVNHFTSSEANASQNQEQLKRESSQATGELSKINQKSSALALEVRLIMRADLLALLPLSFISQVR